MTSESETPNRQFGWYLRKLLFEVLLPAGVAGGIWLNVGHFLAQHSENALLVVPITAAATVLGGMAALLMASEVNTRV